MKKRLKITEGKSFTVITPGLEDPIDSWHEIIVNPVNGWGKWVADSKSASLIDGTIEESEANAELIADAFNTANETQLLPSELKEQRDFYKQAYDLAMELNRTSPCDPDITDEQIQAHKEYHSFVKHNLHIINKIKDNE